MAISDDLCEFRRVAGTYTEKLLCTLPFDLVKLGRWKRFEHYTVERRDTKRVWHVIIDFDDVQASSFQISTQFDGVEKPFKEFSMFDWVNYKKVIDKMYDLLRQYIYLDGATGL